MADHWFRQIEKILEAMEITSDVTEGFRGRQHLLVATEIQKKIPIKTHPRTPSSIKNRFYNKENGVGLPCVGSKTELVVGAALDRSEPSPRFASNGIHMKSEADNLQGNSLATGPGASLVPI